MDWPKIGSYVDWAWAWPYLIRTGLGWAGLGLINISRLLCGLGLGLIILSKTITGPLKKKN